MRLATIAIAFLCSLAVAPAGSAQVTVVLSNEGAGSGLPAAFFGQWIYTADTTWQRGSEMAPWLHDHYHSVEEAEGTCPSAASGYAGKSRGMANYLGARHIMTHPQPEELLPGQEVFDPAKEAQYFGWTTKIIELAQAYGMNFSISLDYYNRIDRDDTAAGWEDRLRARAGALVEACRAKYGALPLRVVYGLEPVRGPGQSWDDAKVRFVQCLGVAYPYLKSRWPSLKVGAYVHLLDLGTNPDFTKYVLQQRSPLLYDFVANDTIGGLADVSRKIDTDDERIEATYTSSVAAEGFGYYGGPTNKTPLMKFRQKLIDIGAPGNVELIGQASALGNSATPTYPDDVNANVPWLGTARDGTYFTASSRFMGVAGVQWMMRHIAPVQINGTWYPGMKYWNWQTWPGVGMQMQPGFAGGLPSSVQRMGEVILSSQYFSGIIAREIKGRAWFVPPTFTNMPYRQNAQGTNIPLIEAWSLREGSTSTHYVVLINHDAAAHTIAINKNGVPGSATTGTLITIGVGAMGNRAKWVCTANDAGYVDNLPAESTETVTLSGFSLNRLSAAVLKFSISG